MEYANREDQNQKRQQQTDKDSKNKTAQRLESGELSLNNDGPAPGSQWRNPSKSENVIQKMEASFGTSFSDVNVHKDSSEATNIGAKAFTRGSDVHFAPGQYNPASKSGQELIGHELAHVVQQRQGRVKPTTQVNGTQINDNPTLEIEADEMGRKAVQFKMANNFQDPDNSNQSNSNSTIVQRFEAPLHESASRNALTANGDFSQDEASMIYYGNWMRDVNQGFVPAAIDILGADTVYALLNYVAYQKFGKAPTSEQMGFYILSEHLDSPVGAIKDSEYNTSAPKISPELEAADYVNPEKSSPVPASKKTKVLPTTPDAKAIPGSDMEIFDVDSSGVMGYIRRTNQHVENRLTLAAEKGRNEEGFLHFGAAMHAIEDLFAHSNYVEIAAEEILNNEMKGTFPELENMIGEIEIQSFSPEVEVSGATPGTSDRRKALVTGSFSSLDTVESVGHELVHMLRQPPKYPSSLDEVIAMNRFMESLSSQVDGGLSDEQNEEILKKHLGFGYGIVKSFAENIGFSTIMKGSNRVMEFLYSNYDEEVKNAVYEMSSLVHQNAMLPLADQVDSLVLESNVANTSMIEVLESSQRIKANKGELNDYVQPTMEMLGEDKDMQKARMEEAVKRSALLENTPEKAIGGPSHSQISKDHKNSVFFGLGFKLAVEADKMIKEKMLAVWGNKKANVGYQDGLTEQRNKNANENLAMGKEILSQGYASGKKPDLQANINETAESINQLADLLVALNQSPANAQAYLKGKQDLIASSEIAGTNPYISNKLDKVLNVTNSGLVSVQQPLKNFELEEASQDLKNLAIRIKNAKTLQERESIYLELTMLRMQFIQHITTIQNDPTFTGNKLTYAAVLTAMDRAIAANAPSFTTKQVNVLAGTKHLQGVDPSLQGELNVNSFKMTSQNSGNSKIDNLINTSRQIIDHPKENSWWKPIMMEYINANKEVMKDYIKARNMGYATFRGKH
ncbi:eCIS core domain-containing protein [Marinigracilibium pacificum]|uniref:DUF4157 domain-containing protein n=1 Tax=Marinigracilibium pacificum TaxID=2729599 RepID=A0A848J4R4_9BACT|nr:DUF4157 domain-containing protein [Marinigracilibium pacificum]NMM50761.1 DUF4157 domain-containing protein [Marinigracilibium pacificum]